jgi:hypothetical protein
MLAGGVNLVREPRNGRNFEYGGEDPLLAGKMVGAQIKGIQSNAIVSTIKHYALNGQETGRFVLTPRSATPTRPHLRPAGLPVRHRGLRPALGDVRLQPVNGDYACENDFLLNTVLKKDWAYKGYVMSDWGAVHSSAKAANAGSTRSRPARPSTSRASSAPAEGRPGQGRGQPGPPGRHGPPHPARPVRQRRGRKAGQDRPDRLRRPRQGHPRRRRGGVVLLKNDKGPAAAGQDRQEDRRDRRPCRRRRAVGRRLVAGLSDRRPRRAGPEGPRPGPAR